MILALKTNADPTKVYLLTPDSEVVREKKWNAERTLAKNLLNELSKLLDGDFKQLTGLAVFQGPGSFTGLRIGITVANTIAYAEDLPIVGTQGDNWLVQGIKRLAQGENDKTVVPFYGGEANISKPKK